MNDLSETQRTALKFVTGDVLTPQMYGPTRVTLAALSRKGYLHKVPGTSRFHLTNKGQDAHEKLVNETCVSCGARTHVSEAACIECGAVKKWAQSSVKGASDAD